MCPTILMQVTFPLIYPLRTYTLLCLAFTHTIPKYNANHKSEALNLRSIYQKTKGEEKTKQVYTYNCTTNWNESPHLHSYINAVPHESPHIPLCQQMGLTILPADDCRTNMDSQVRPVAKAPGGCLEDVRSN